MRSNSTNTDGARLSPLSGGEINEACDVSSWPVASLGAAQANVGVRGNSGSRCRMLPKTLLTDAVEKVGPLIGINALGIFDPAETGRRFGFTAA